jgi:large subunit ribosomal protein L24
MGVKSKNSQIPQSSFHVKKNDVVVVTSGSQRGQRGKILQILTKKNRVLIEGVRLIKKTARKTQDNPQGGIVEREGSIHISNVMLAEKYDTRRGTTPATEKAPKAAKKK